MVKSNKPKTPTSKIYDGELYDHINSIVEKFMGVLFNKIKFDEESLKILTEFTSTKKNIVYASFHTSNISLIILYNLLRNHNFEKPVFALEYNPFLLQPIGFIWKRILKLFNQLILRKKYKYILDTDFLQNLILNKKTFLLSLMSKKFFVKRYIEIKYDSLLYLIEVQKKMDEPIYLLPQMIFWNKNPERTTPKNIIGTTPKDIVTSSATGDKGLIAGWMATFKSVTPAFVRISTPVNLKEEIAASTSDDSWLIALEVRKKLLGIYHQEKRSILGPVVKSRQEMIDKVLYHRNVIDAISTISKAEKTPESVLRKKAYKYYKEIAADFSIVVIHLFARSLDFVFRRIYDGINYDSQKMWEIREAAQKGPLVFTPCHKSHMDYLILSYLFYRNNLIPPHIAAGVNLTFFPMGTVFRHSGAFFLRRSFKGLKLYPVIFKQYVKTLISEGYGIEFFIEGGRTRTGKLAYPKFGFLSYLIEAIEEGYHKDLVFVPIAINYDRILEEQSYVQELKGKEKQTESIVSMMESRKLLNRKYGKAYVTFNTPFGIKDIMEKCKDKEDIPIAIANTIIRRINEVTVVTPFALITLTILISSVKGFSRQMLIERIHATMKFLVLLKIQTSESLKDASNIDEIVDYAIKAYMEDKIIEELRVEGGKKKEVMKDFYVLREDNRARIVFYKNSIIHYFIYLSFTSNALLLLSKKENLSLDAFKEEFNFLKDFFSKEFIYPEDNINWNLPIPADVYDYMISESFIKIENNSITINEDKLNDLKYYSKIIQDYFESYLVVLRTLLDQKVKKLSRKELVTDIRKSGVRMYHIGDIHLSESLSLPNYQNALEYFVKINIFTERIFNPKNVEVVSVDKDKALEFFEKIQAYLDILT